MPFSRMRRGLQPSSRRPGAQMPLGFANESEFTRPRAKLVRTLQHKLEGKRAPMRVARLIACLVIGVVFPGQLTSLFGQGVATLIHDVSDMADGSVTQARIEAQRQAASGDLAYRSYTKGDPSSFSGKYTRRNSPTTRRVDLSMDSPCSRTTVAV